MRALLRSAVSLASSKGGKGRLLVLFYHRVHREPDPLRPSDVDARTFAWQMRMLARYFTPLRLEDAVRQLRAGSLPTNAICVSFDDGYADNVEVALPILQRYSVPATFFLTTGFFGNGCMWNDRVIELIRAVKTNELSLKALGLGEYRISSMDARLHAVNGILRKLKHLPRGQRDLQVQRLQETLGIDIAYAPMMNQDQVHALTDAGMGIGAHTINHPILSRIDLDEAKHEIEAGKQQLERLIGEAVTLFAYPNGVPGQDYGIEHVHLVRAAGFDAAFSTAWGAAQVTDDPLQTPRIAPWDNTPLRFFVRLLRSYGGDSGERVLPS